MRAQTTNQKEARAQEVAGAAKEIRGGLQPTRSTRGLGSRWTGIRRNSLYGELKHLTIRPGRRGQCSCSHVRQFEKNCASRLMQGQRAENLASEDCASRGQRFVVGYYMFYVSLKNLVEGFGIPLSGARTPREGGLIDSRRHVRARAHRLWRQRGAFLSG